MPMRQNMSEARKRARRYLVDASRIAVLVSAGLLTATGAYATCAEDVDAFAVRWEQGSGGEGAESADGSQKFEEKKKDAEMTTPNSRVVPDDSEFDTGEQDPAESTDANDLSDDQMSDAESADAGMADDKMSDEMASNSGEEADDMEVMEDSASNEGEVANITVETDEGAKEIVARDAQPTESWTGGYSPDEESVQQLMDEARTAASSGDEATCRTELAKLELILEEKSSE